MKEKNISRHQLRNWLIVEAVVIVVCSVMAFALVDYVRNVKLGQNAAYNPLAAIGMIQPMALVTGLIFFTFSRRLTRHIGGLTEGLKAVAEGGLGLRLDPAQGGPLAGAYGDFNHMSAQLESVQTLRMDFIHNFSHEFKTPITAIAGFAELLQDPACPDEDRAQYLQVIVQEVARLSELASSTLLLSSLDSQELVLEKAPYALDEQIKQCAILLSAAWEKKKITFTADLLEVTYRGNAEMMRHVWLNLLNNAVKYTPEGGEIEVRMTVEAERVIVAVADTGRGMTPEVRDHVFDKYYQGDPSHSETGLGLGLSIVHRIVELCGGAVTVDSRPGEGSTFTVTLPV